MSRDANAACLEIHPDAELILGEDPRKVEIDCFNDCAERWSANRDVDTGLLIRPTEANGFALQCTDAGTTGRFEPRWPTELEKPVNDGSVVWKVVQGGDNGINPLSDPEVSGVSPAAGLNVSAATVMDSRRITALYEPVVAGVYTVMFAFVVNGEKRKARHRVVVVGCQTE